MKMLKTVSLVCVAMGMLGASSLKDAIENATVDGWAQGKYFYSSGPDGDGRGYQMMFRPNVHSGEVDGYSITAGVFAAYGPGVPDGVTSDDSIGGSRAPRIDGNNPPDVFNISNLYVNKNFDIQAGAQTLSWTLRAGQMNIETALNAGTSYADRGIGGMLQIVDKDLGLKFYASGYDTWMTDNIFLAFNQSGTYGIGNNIVFLGLEGDDKVLNGFGFKLYWSYAQQLFNTMAFGDIHYKYKFDSGLTLGALAQVAGTVMNNNANFHSQSKNSTNLQNYFAQMREGPYNGYAPTRGLFNLQVNLKAGGYSSKLGYLASFGRGYGVVLDSKGGFDVGGQLWNGIMSGGMMGFGWTGTGAADKTGIQAIYWTHRYKMQEGIFKNLGFGLDLAWVTNGYEYGNRYPFMKKGSTKLMAQGIGGNIRGQIIPARGTNWTEDIDSLFEISPQISYDFTKNFNGSITYSQLLGGMTMGRTVLALRYNF